MRYVQIADPALVAAVQCVLAQCALVTTLFGLQNSRGAELTLLWLFGCLNGGSGELVGGVGRGKRIGKLHGIGAWVA